MNIRQLFLAIIAVVAVESVLILLGILPPLSQGSFFDSVFQLVRTLIILYSGWLATGFLKAAKNGAIVAGAGSLTFFIATLLGFFLKIPVLGVPVSSGLEVFIILLVSFVINVLLGSVVGCVGYLIGPWLAGRLSKKDSKKKK